MNLFYVDPENIYDRSLIIDGQEADHIMKVLRHSIGDTIFVTDGKGKRYECRISDYQSKKVFLNIHNVEKEKLDEPIITLCLGMIKKRDRLEFAVEKAVELGVLKIVIFSGDHSQKGNVRKERLHSTAISAMKQSLRLYRPEIFIEISLDKAISCHAGNSTVVVADESVEKGEAFETGQSCLLVVGPEGGFSEAEREYLKGIDAQFYSLGEKRLRTETAAIVIADRFLAGK